MNLSAVQNYQVNQNLAGWVQQSTEAGAMAETEEQNEPQDGLHVLITDLPKVYDWIAYSQQDFSATEANISRFTGLLSEYQLIDMTEAEILNKLPTSADSTVTERLNLALDEETSFLAKQRLTHLVRVFETLEAAQQSFKVA